MFDVSKSIIQEIKIDHLSERNIHLFVKRDDLIHPLISGNKWRKLKYNVEVCLAQKKEGILTFGGAYSNHLVATAATCHKLKVNSIGIVRGEELNAYSNETLKQCHDLGMQLVFISRSEYKLRNEKAFIEEKAIQFPNYFIVPEGGSNYYGIIGCQEILSGINQDVDHVFVAQGTSTTSCGIALSLKENQTLHVVPALKGYHSLEEMKLLYLQSALAESEITDVLQRVVVHNEFHFGGYGKVTDDLVLFIQDIFKNYQLKLDPVYTAKTMFALMDVVQDASFDNSTILFVHTGGLQGVKGIEKQIGVELF